MPYFTLLHLYTEKKHRLASLNVILSTFSLSSTTFLLLSNSCNMCNNIKKSPKLSFDFKPELSA